MPLKFLYASKKRPGSERAWLLLCGKTDSFHLSECEKKSQAKG